MTSFQFPTWYEGHFDDIESAVIKILNTWLEDVTPTVTVRGWFPVDWRDLMPLISVARVPGGLPDASNIDGCVVDVWVVTGKRSDSWELAEFVRAVFSAYDHGAVVEVGSRKVDIRSIKPAELPHLDIQDSEFLERVIPMSFQVTTRKAKSRPNYRDVLKP